MKTPSDLRGQHAGTVRDSQHGERGQLCVPIRGHTVPRPQPQVLIPTWVVARLMAYAVNGMLDDGTAGDEWAYLEACEAMATQAPDEPIPAAPPRRLRLVKR